MKTIKINEKVSIKIAESDLELTESRNNSVSQALLLLVSSDNETVLSIIEQTLDYINKGMYLNASFVLQNYKLLLNVRQNDVSLWAMIFANITFLDDKETKKALSKEEILQKMEILENAGLLFETVKKEVINFMKVYPQIYATYRVLAR